MLSEVGFDNFIKISLPQKKELLQIFSNKQQLVIFDIGACEGEDSIRYIKLFPNSRVHSFEPVPSNFKIASENIRRFNLQQSIVLNKIALSDKEGTAELFVSSGKPTDIEPQPNWDYGNKSSSLLPPQKTLEIVPWLKFKKTIKIKTTTLDEYCELNKITTIDIIHMDVQGAELLVLKGGPHMLKSVKSIWLEVEAVELYKDQPLKKDVERFMKKTGFVKFIDTVDNVAGDQLYVSKDIAKKLNLIKRRKFSDRLKIGKQ